MSTKKKTKSPRNRTIDTSLKDGKRFFERCIEIDNKISDASEVLDKTICGDTFEVLHFLPNGIADLIVVDPPYNLRKNYHGNVFNKKKSDEYKAYTESWIEKVKPLLKENGSMYVCCDWQSSMIIGEVLSHHFHIQNRITWQREKGRGAKANWKNSMEDIWFVTNSNSFTFNVEDVKTRKEVVAPYKKDGKPKDWVESNEGNYRDTHPSNFWSDITIPFWSMPENTEHPTQKSEKLLAKIILASSNPGDVVLDPFLGSGTTSVVAKKLGRRYVGIETNPQYCLWAEERLEMANDDKTIQGYCDGVFWERNTFSKQR